MFGCAAVVVALGLLNGALGRSAASAPARATTKPERAPSREAPGDRHAAAATRAGNVAAPARSPETARGKTWMTLAWGGGPGQLGRELPREGSPIGPMSVAVDAKGRALVVDPVNGRVVRFGRDGKPELTIPVAPTAQDVAVAANGSILVLDRHGERSVAIFDEHGAPSGKLDLVGEGIATPGVVTGVFVDGDDVYAETKHDGLVRLGTIDGAPVDARARVPGRPSRDGKSFLRAGLANRQTGSAWIGSIDRANGEERYLREVRFAGTLRTIELLDSDRSGTVYLGVTVTDGAGKTTLDLACVDATTGARIGGATLPVNELPDETFRDLTVLDEGGVLYAERTTAGVTYERFGCEGP